MDIIILTFLLCGVRAVSCFHTVLYEYHFINIALNWTDARSYCREHHTDLATFWSLEDISRVERPSGYGGYAWIGLFDDPASWKGVMGNDSNSWRWSATGTTNPGGYQRWYTGQPDYYVGKERCVTSVNGFWVDKPCINRYRVACFTGSAAPGQKNYTFVTTPMNWEDARSYCRQNYTDLAMIEDEAENTKVAALYPGYTVWIGLYREPWRWSGESQSHFTKWASSYPSGTQPCARENPTYFWNDVSCTDELPFICHQRVMTKRLILMNFQSAADFSEPGIRDQIITQVTAELERRGVTDVRLKWKTPPRRV